MFPSIKCLIWILIRSETLYNAASQSQKNFCAIILLEILQFLSKCNKQSTQIKICKLHQFALYTSWIFILWFLFTNSYSFNTTDPSDNRVLSCFNCWLSAWVGKCLFSNSRNLSTRDCFDQTSERSTEDTSAPHQHIPPLKLTVQSLK